MTPDDRKRVAALRWSLEGTIMEIRGTAGLETDDRLARLWPILRDLADATRVVVEIIGRE